MHTGLVIGRILIFICIFATIFCIIKADKVARFTFNFRKKDWNLKENIIPRLSLICRIWNSIMLIILIYLCVTLPNYL